MSTAVRLAAAIGYCSLLLTALAACVGGYGYDTDLGVRYSPDYTEPFRYEVGGWGGGYRVGPGQRGEPRSTSTSSDDYQSAARSRLTPSLPNRSRDTGGSSDQK